MKPSRILLFLFRLSLLLIAALLVAQVAPLQITTTSVPDAQAGQPYAFQFTATGGYGTANYSWFLEVFSSGFPFALSTNGVLSGTPPALGIWSFQIVVRDNVTGQIARGNYTVTASSTGGTGLQITTTSVPNASVGLNYSFQFEATGGFSYSWGIASGNVPPGLTLSTSGLLSGIPQQSGSYVFVVQVYDQQTQQITNKTFGMSVTSGVLRIIETTIPFGVVGQPYSVTLHGDGGAPPYTWLLESGSVNGLNIDFNSGVLSGTPQSNGNFTVGVILRDAAGQSLTYRYSLFVAAPLSVVTSSLPNGALNTNYVQPSGLPVVLEAGGGQSPYRWQIISGGLPPGLTLDGNTGRITGTPTAEGRYNIGVRVTDAGSRTASKDLSILVGQGLQITTTTLPDGSVNVAYNQTLAASGGQTPYSWAVSSGALPGGLTLASNGTLSGTPSASGNFTFTVTVTDAQNSTAQRTYSMNIVNPLSITTTSAADGIRNVSYSQAFGASGGTPAYTWSVSSGSLPPGLALNPSTALVSGIPTQTGRFQFTLQVRDTQGQTATADFVIGISDPLSITTTSLTGQFGTAFSGSVAAAGGFTPYTFSVASGALPGGLSLNASTGAITGTATASGTFPVTFRVTDARGQSATGAVNITINLPTPPPLTLTLSSPTPAAAQQLGLTLTLGSTFPADINGVLTMTFAPVSGPDDPNVRFANGLRTLNYNVPQGQTRATFPSLPGGAVIMTGTVAGTITITTSVLSGGQNITPSPAPTQRIDIPAGPPVITRVELQQSGNTVNVNVTGYSTTREVTSGTFRFAAATGSTLTQSEFTVQLGPTFTTWYQNAQSAQFGSQFTLTVPFTVQGSATSVVSVTVTLTNTRGTSAAATP
jgi:hypothetical protein